MSVKRFSKGDAFSTLVVATSLGLIAVACSPEKETKTQATQEESSVSSDVQKEELSQDEIFEQELEKYAQRDEVKALENVDGHLFLVEHIADFARQPLQQEVVVENGEEKVVRYYGGMGLENNAKLAVKFGIMAAHRDDIKSVGIDAVEAFLQLNAHAMGRAKKEMGQDDNSALMIADHYVSTTTRSNVAVGESVLAQIGRAIKKFCETNQLAAESCISDLASLEAVISDVNEGKFAEQEKAEAEEKKAAEEEAARWF